MDLSAFSKLLFLPDNPLLPSATAIWLALHLGWAIVLGSGALLMASKLARRYRWALSLLVLLWALLPGAVSPAYWLGLAFQTPSLMSAVICLGCLLQRARRELGLGVLCAESDLQALKILLLLGVVLGWVLLLDTLAWLPVSVYAWGFGSAALAATLVFAALLWLLRGSPASAFLFMVLTLFVLSRLPTGNLWDALLDPWLWLLLQLGWLVSVVRRLWLRRRLSPATRA